MKFWAIGLAILASGCASSMPKGVSRQGQIAIYSRQIVTMADALLTELDAQAARMLATEAVRHDPDEARKIRQAVVKSAAAIGIVGDIAQDLAVALRVWHEAVQAGKTTQTQAERVAIILHSLQRQLGQIALPIDDPTIRAGVQGSIDAMLSLVLNIGSLVAAPAQPVARPGPVASNWSGAAWSLVVQAG